MNLAPEVIVLYCGNTLAPGACLPDGWSAHAGFKARFVGIPCSIKIEPLYLVKLFEHSVDAVLVVACLRQDCRFLFGSSCMEQRVKYVQQLLQEVGLGQRRLSLISKGNLTAAELINLAGEAAASAGTLGLNPLKKALAGAH